VEISDGLDTKAKGKAFVSVADRTPVVQSVVTHCTDLSYHGSSNCFRKKREILANMGELRSILN
jgi:hypothetical protein